jgi:hypothetical protein
MADHPDWLFIDHSQLERWEQCPRKYKYEYVDHLAKQTSWDTEFGTALHKLLSKWYLTGPNWYPNTNELRQIWDEFSETIASAAQPRQDRLPIFTVDHLTNCFSQYIDRYRPDFETYRVVSSEEVYFREISEGVIWLAKLDLLLERIGDGQLVNNDFKHSTWDFNRDLLAFDRQFVGQSFAADTKWMIKSFFHSALPRSRPGQAVRPTINIYRPTEPADSELTTEWLEETRMMLKPILEARKTDVYPKRAPRACMDFNRLCEFSELCVIGRKAAKMLIEDRERVNSHDYLGL